MKQDLVKRSRDSVKLLSIYNELGFNEAGGRRPIGEIMEFIPDRSTGLPPFRSALRNIEARWSVIEGRWLHSVLFYFAPIPAISKGDYMAIKLVPPRVDERIPGEACVFDPLSTHDEPISGILRFAPRTEESWQQDKLLMKQTILQKVNMIDQLAPDRRNELLQVFYRRFGLIGNPSEKVLTMAAVKRVIGKTMGFEHTIMHKEEQTGTERPIEEIVFYGCVADFVAEWYVEPIPNFLLSFRFSTHSRFDTHRVHRIEYCFTSTETGSRIVFHDGTQERILPGILAFAD